LSCEKGVNLPRRNVGQRQVAAFRCAAEFGRFRGMADNEQAAPIKFGIIKGIPERTEKWHHTPDV
jgi:hypothetical protein